MDFLTTGVNESPVISMVAAAELGDVRGKAVRFNDSGKIVLAGAGEAALGIGIMSNNDHTSAGDPVDIQHKDIGLVKAGAAITAGAELTPDADGALVAATSGAYCAIALHDGKAAGEFIRAIIVRGYKPASAG